MTSILIDAFHICLKFETRAAARVSFFLLGVDAIDGIAFIDMGWIPKKNASCLSLRFYFFLISVVFIRLL